MKPRYLYHCSQEVSSDTLVPKLRVPVVVDDKEPPTPRFCVSPTVPQCVAARLFPVDAPVSIYRSEKKLRGVRPRGVWDSTLTEERWIVTPSVFKKVGEIGTVEVQLLEELPRAYHGRGWTSSVKLRMARLDIVANVLPEKWVPKWLRVWAKECCEHFGAKSGEEIYLKELESKL